MSNLFGQPTSIEIFTDPLRTTYLLNTKPFIMPTTTGGIYAIAVDDNVAYYLVAFYAILITGIFGFAWQLITYFVLLFYPTEEYPREKPPMGIERGVKEKDFVFIGRAFASLSEKEQKLLELRRRKANRYITLVTVWNCGDPWSVMFLLAGHAWAMCFKAKDKMTGVFDSVVLFAAVLVVVGNLLGGILIPRQLDMGKVAPVDPVSVFYAIPITLQDSIRIQQMRAPAAQRAMGVVESARVKLEQIVPQLPKEEMDWKGPDGQVIERIPYAYNMTGVDFGLQHLNAADFVLSVKGACTLEYGWFNASASAGTDYDIYDIFDSQYPISRITSAPAGGLVQVPVQIDPEKSNRSYAILPDTVGRWSYSAGTDPWYTTIENPDAISGGPEFIVDGQRPVLSCWQDDTWSYKQHTASSVVNLASLPGLNLPNVIQSEFIPSRMLYPMIYDVASSLGASILVSSTSSSGGTLDASISGYSVDFYRLILASFTASREILRDTTMITNTYGIKNSAFQDPITIPKPGSGAFVVYSSKVVTLSLKILISIPSIWVFLRLVLFLLTCARCTTRNSGAPSRFTIRQVGLHAVHMYRFLDEEMCGYRDDWTDRTAEMPYISAALPLSRPAAETQALLEKKGAVVSVGAEGEDTSETIQPVSRAESVPNKTYLFVAPKVVIGAGDKYHLKFTGPMDHEPKGNSKWSWVAPKESNASPIVDSPGEICPP